MQCHVSLVRSAPCLVGGHVFIRGLCVLRSECDGGLDAIIYGQALLHHFYRDFLHGEPHRWLGDDLEQVPAPQFFVEYAGPRVLKPSARADEPPRHRLADFQHGHHLRAGAEHHRGDRKHHLLYSHAKARNIGRIGGRGGEEHHGHHNTGSPERPAIRLIHPEISDIAFYFDHNRISKILRLDQSKRAKSVGGKSRPRICENCTAF
mmetsp:Transcript_105677/g.305533  ORF Transcript_105677/g.305533 Transcript_105677/m.305533 type:complete len:206 (+) Transcript_105677:291-908(+)